MNRITKNISISLDPTLLEQAKKRAALYGFKHSFSAYIAFLINEDLDSEVDGEPHGFDLSGPQSGNGPKQAITPGTVKAGKAARKAAKRKPLS